MRYIQHITICMVLVAMSIAKGHAADSKMVARASWDAGIEAYNNKEYAEAVEAFAKGAKERGIKVIIAAAGMAAHLPGAIAASTTLPVIGVPINSTLDGMDALLAIVQMPPGIPVATVGVNASLNAAILAVEMLALADAELADRLAAYKENLKKKIEKANEDLKGLEYEYKTN